MSKSEALLLCHRIPYPPDKGDKIRSWRILDYLRTRFDVHLAAFVDDPDDWRHEPFLASLTASLSLIPLHRGQALARSLGGLVNGAPLSLCYYRDRRMVRAVEALRRRRLRLEFAFSSSMAPYIETRGRCPRVVDLCDADSAKWRAYAAARSFPLRQIYRREAATLSVVETRIINWADATFAISAEEAEVLAAATGVRRKVDWFGNGVDAAYFDPHTPLAPSIERSAPEASSADVVFTGAMDYKANVDAAVWFATAIWPHVRARMPSARFAIVGARPAPAVRALAGVHGISVTGRVADIRPFLFGAKVAVAPLRIARGVQNKALEALAAGRALVATSAAIEGIRLLPDQHVLVRDEARAFADAVSDLLADEGRRAALGDAARGHMIERYGWGAQFSRLDRTVEHLLAES